MKSTCCGAFAIRIKIDNISLGRVDAYTNIINKYQLNRDTLEKLVKCIS